MKPSSSSLLVSALLLVALLVAGGATAQDTTTVADETTTMDQGDTTTTMPADTTTMGGEPTTTGDPTTAAPPPGAGCNEAGECTGVILDLITDVSDYESCAEECKDFDNEEGRCQHFTYYSQYRDCYLFADCTLTEGCSDCESGKIICIHKASSKVANRNCPQIAMQVLLSAFICWATFGDIA